METTYTIEFMRLAEPHLAPIKRPSAFHVAYYCNISPTLKKPSADAQKGDSILVIALSEGVFVFAEGFAILLEMRVCERSVRRGDRRPHCMGGEYA